MPKFTYPLNVRVNICLDDNYDGVPCHFFSGGGEDEDQINGKLCNE